MTVRPFKANEPVRDRLDGRAPREDRRAGQPMRLPRERV
jgi:hypothetical protein